MLIPYAARNPGWHQVGVKESVLAIISQQSTRVFLGQEFCRDDRWLNTTARVTVLAFQAVEQVRMWPAIVRPIAAQFLPVFQRLRAEIQTARKMIDPIVQQRRRVKAQVLAQGKTPVPSLDTIEWAEELADGHEYDPAVLQLTITLSAMHNTTDFMTQLLYDLAARPELVQELRQEIISVRQQYSWSKQAIFNLKLMDSVMKESQRLKPTSLGEISRVFCSRLRTNPLVMLVTMRRTAEATFILPDGPLVQKGDLVMVSTNNHWDPEIYPKPDKFDPYRFLRLLEQEQWGSAPHMVSTCENHLGFGHGTWACSGRFFAVAETKVALCHILMKYDLKLVGGPPPPVINGTFISANPSGKIAIRRRQEEDML
jgi:cytochrome P450